MLRRILLEIGVLIACLSLAPAVIIAILIHEDIFLQGYYFFVHRALTGAPFSEFGFGMLLFKWISPYLIVQAVRAFIWSKSGPTARRWANLYFAALLGSMSIWFFSRLWDMFYFMYELGDIPAALGQFARLEWRNLLLFGVSFIMALYCLTVSLHPDRRTTPSQ